MKSSAKFLKCEMFCWVTNLPVFCNGEMLNVNNECMEMLFSGIVFKYHPNIC